MEAHPDNDEVSAVWGWFEQARKDPCNGRLQVELMYAVRRVKRLAHDARRISLDDP